MSTDDFELPSWKRDFERSLNRAAARIDAALLRFGEAVSRALRRVADWIDEAARPHPLAR
ncbi:MAG TPA: hypothetical protein VF765_21025 [Polyangiaceae bacterium]